MSSVGSSGGSCGAQRGQQEVREGQIVQNISCANSISSSIWSAKSSWELVCLDLSGDTILRDVMKGPLKGIDLKQKITMKKGIPESLLVLMVDQNCCSPGDSSFDLSRKDSLEESGTISGSQYTGAIRSVDKYDNTAGGGGGGLPSLTNYNTSLNTCSHQHGCQQSGVLLQQQQYRPPVSIVDIISPGDNTSLDGHAHRETHTEQLKDDTSPAHSTNTNYTDDDIRYIKDDDFINSRFVNFDDDIKVSERKNSSLSDRSSPATSSKAGHTTSNLVATRSNSNSGGMNQPLSCSSNQAVTLNQTVGSNPENIQDKQSSSGTKKQRSASGQLLMLTNCFPVCVVRVLVQVADFSQFHKKVVTAMEWRKLSESGLTKCREFVFQQEHMRFFGYNVWSIPKMLCMLANNTGLENLLSAYVENEAKTPTEVFLQILPPDRRGSKEREHREQHIPPSTDVSFRADSTSPPLLLGDATSSIQPISGAGGLAYPTAIVGSIVTGSGISGSSTSNLTPYEFHLARGRDREQQPDDSSTSEPEGGSRPGSSGSQAPDSQVPGARHRNWPALFFILRKAEFSPRIRQKLLDRSDANILLNWVHPLTGETALMLAGLFSGQQIILDILNKIEITTNCVNSISILAAGGTGNGSSNNTSGTGNGGTTNRTIPGAPVNNLNRSNSSGSIIDNLNRYINKVANTDGTITGISTGTIIDNLNKPFDSNGPGSNNGLESVDGENQPAVSFLPSEMQKNTSDGNLQKNTSDQNLCAADKQPMICSEVKQDLRKQLPQQLTPSQMNMETCSTCLANFFMVNCQFAFEKILSREDLTEDMLIATYRYLLYFEQKNATAILKNKKKLQKLEWHKEKLAERFQNRTPTPESDVGMS